MTVADAVFACGVVDARDPEGSEVALAVAAVAIGVTQGLDDALFGQAITAGAVVLHAFGAFQDLFVFLAGRDASFDSHD